MGIFFNPKFSNKPLFGQPAPAEPGEKTHQAGFPKAVADARTPKAPDAEKKSSGGPDRFESALSPEQSWKLFKLGR